MEILINSTPGLLSHLRPSRVSRRSDRTRQHVQSTAPPGCPKRYVNDRETHPWRPTAETDSRKRGRSHGAPWLCGRHGFDRVDPDTFPEIFLICRSCTLPPRPGLELLSRPRRPVALDAGERPPISRLRAASTVRRSLEAPPSLLHSMEQSLRAVRNRVLACPRKNSAGQRLGEEGAQAAAGLAHGARVEQEARVRDGSSLSVFEDLRCSLRYIIGIGLSIEAATRLAWNSHPQAQQKGEEEEGGGKWRGDERRKRERKGTESSEERTEENPSEETTREGHETRERRMITEREELEERR